MKNALLIATTLLLATPLPVAYGQGPADQWKPNGTVTVSLQERYIGLRISRVLHDDMSLLSSVTVNLPAGLYVDVLNHHGIEGRDRSRQPNELDLTLGVRRDLPWLGLEVGLFATYFNNSPTRVWRKNDVWVQAITLSKTHVLRDHTLRPQLRVEWLSRTTDIGGGAYVLLPNISHVWNRPLGVKPLSLVHQAFVVHDDGFVPARNDRQGYFIRWNAGLRWQVGKRVNLTLPSYTTQIPLHRGHDGREQVSSWGVSLSSSF